MALGVLVLVVLICMLALEQGGDDVEEADTGVIENFEVRYVGIHRQDIVAGARLHEVDAVERVTFVVDVFVRGGDTRLEKRTDPGNESMVLVFKEVHPGIDLLINVYRQRRFKVERQLADEV